MAKRSLPIRVPCQEGERWQDMAREDGGRRCLRCDDHVVDLSALTEAQVEELRRLVRGKQVCAAVSLDSEGAPIYRRSTVRRLVRSAAGVVMSVSLAPCSGEGDGVTVTQLEPATATEAEAEAEVVAEPKGEPPVEREADSEPEPTAECENAAETGPVTSEGHPRRRVRRRGPRTEEPLILGLFE